MRSENGVVVKERISHKRYKRYYASLLLVNLVIFNFIITIFGVIAYSANRRTATITYLQQYDKVLVDIMDYYKSKHDNFHYLMLPIFINNNVISDMNKFYDDPTDAIIYIDPAFAKRLLALLGEISERDRDVAMIYLSKSITESIFAYNCLDNSLIRQNNNISFADMTYHKNGQRLLSASQIVSTAMRKEIIANTQIPIYCISGLINLDGNEAGLWDRIILGYRADAYNRIIKENIHDKEIRYGLITDVGNIIYDSANNYASMAYTTLDIKDSILGAEEVISIDGTKHIKQMLVDQGRGIIAFYTIPLSYVVAYRGGVSTTILILVISFIITSILIYAIFVKSSGKRIKQIERGMYEISRHNLAYRIPEMSQNDEISLVAMRFNEMCDQLKDTIDRCYLYDIRQKEASFYALQTSINPHFLYNTLEAVRGQLALSGHFDASEMIVMLSRLFEYQFRGASFVTIGQELDALEMYVAFFALRYEDAFAYTSDITSEVMNFALPKFTLQPILENYFIHGFQPNQGNDIRIQMKKNGDDIHIIVQDNGQGIESERLKKIQDSLTFPQNSSCYGLVNVHQRLRYVFGETYGITSIQSSGYGQGTAVYLKVKAMSVDALVARIEKQ